MYLFYYSLLPILDYSYACLRTYLLVELPFLCLHYVDIVAGRWCLFYYIMLFNPHEGEVYPGMLCIALLLRFNVHPAKVLYSCPGATVCDVVMFIILLPFLSRSSHC